MPDLSRRACPDHPCDRCATCRSGRCCLNDSPMPHQSVIDHTTSMLFGAMMADREARTSLGVEAPGQSEESHRVIWVANKPQRSDSPSTAEEASRAREHRTREKWARERGEPTRVDVHHHLHQQGAPAHPGEDDVIDAEVVDEFDQPEALGAGHPNELPRGSSSDDPFAWLRHSEEDRRDR